MTTPVNRGLIVDSVFWLIVESFKIQKINRGFLASWTLIWIFYIVDTILATQKFNRGLFGIVDFNRGTPQRKINRGFFASWICGF